MLRKRCLGIKIFSRGSASHPATQREFNRFQSSGLIAPTLPLRRSQERVFKKGLSLVHANGPTERIRGGRRGLPEVCARGNYGPHLQLVAAACGPRQASRSARASRRRRRTAGRSQSSGRSYETFHAPRQGAVCTGPPTCSLPTVRRVFRCPA